ncbi:MAG TPA: hypothetical protein O0Y02_03060 [Methanocorpusculum sp.]|nr:hypothetical protein [Methanocorpusculum sp.]
MKKFTRICLAGFFAGAACLLLSGILPLAEFPAQLLFGFGIALMILGFSNLLSQLIVSKTETEETVKVKRVEENDERNIRIRERAGFRTSQIILGALCICALTSAFANFELYVTLIFVGLILLHGILLVGFSIYYEKRF